MKSKIVKVGENGKVVLPFGMRKDLHVRKGDELVALSKGSSIVLMKIDYSDDFSDLSKASEISLRKMWDNEVDEIWNSYLEK